MIMDRVGLHSVVLPVLTRISHPYSPALMVRSLWDLFWCLQTGNEKFVKEKQSGKVASERENMLKELATAYDIYMELLANLQEGTKVMLSL